jgi:hypothetical protein
MDSVYMNPSESVDVRIKNLLFLMTLKEKIGQMTQIERSVTTPSAIKDFTIGTLSEIHLCFCFFLLLSFLTNLSHIFYLSFLTKGVSTVLQLL